MSSPDINYPAQPSYGEGLSESLKAQADFLRGTGDFADVGSLESLLPLEERIRKQTAQTDTDVLRQTLQGDESVVQADELGRVIEGYVDPGPDVTTIENEIDQYEQYVKNNPDVLNAFNSPDGDREEKFAKQGMAAFGKAHYEKFGTAENRTLPEIGKSYNADGSEFARQPIMSKEGAYTPGQYVRQGQGMVDLLGDTRQLIGEDRTAGFDDMGNFLGLSALTEDIGTSQQSRQRERDLADVERLSGRYKDVMDKFREEDIMTSVGEVGGPQDVFLNDMRNLRAGPEGEAGPVGATGPAGTAGQVAPVGVTSTPAPAVSPSAPVDPMLAQIAQTGTPTGAGLRETLANEALLGLRSGLTEREERQIAEAARARSTMMGRTFDQSAAIEEAGARVAEDNQRRMQNLALAQSVLGQEGGLRMQELAMQQRNNLDPFTAILGRSGGSTVGQAGQVLGQAGYGLQSAPQYLNPEAGLGYIQTQSTNAANVAAAQAGARGAAQAGLMSGLGSLGGGLLGNPNLFKCWVAREVYGVHNPAWLLFRNWLNTEAPRWFDKLYIKYGERFARFISDKPRLKARIRMWMDKKIGGQ